jgi:holo-[acyl-carrier protein] synthase
MIGIDLIKVSRMGRFMERFGNKALCRFLSDEEISIVKNHKTASGFWAAKEACAKALGVGISMECGFHDIVIYKSERGAPKLKLSQKILKNFNILEASLSITHDGEYAIAVVALSSASTNKIE